MKTVKVQLDRRHDGRYSVTVKLVAWSLNELRGFASLLLRGPMGRRAGEQLFEALEEMAETLQDESGEQSISITQPQTLSAALAKVVSRYRS